MADTGGDTLNEKKKAHRERKSGRKAERKKTKRLQDVGALPDKQNNPKAFALHSVVQAERRFRRKQDLTTKKQHIPVVDRTPLDPPPFVVAIVGPPKVGKSTLVKDLVKHFSRTPLTNIQGPVTVVAGKRQRLTFMECDNDVNSMIDLAKVADLVLLMVDAAFGFEMEVFEFLNICQVHGMPRILGVLTHLDLLKQAKTLKRTKKTLKHRFWTEVYSGAKLFYLSGILHDEYLRNDVRNLARFISVIKFRPLAWRSTHPYMLADRIEDMTPAERIRLNPKADRDVALYGYMRGVPLNPSNRVHIPGYGDLQVSDVTFLPDPCPFPEKKKRALLEREKTLYAPFSGVQGIVYDKDAVYVHVPNQPNQEKNEEEMEIVESILTTKDTVDVKRDNAQLQLFSFSQPIKSKDFEDNASSANQDQDRQFEEEMGEDGRIRRRVVFNNSVTGIAGDTNEDIENSSDEDEEDDPEDESDNEEVEDEEDGEEPIRKEPRVKDTSISNKISSVLKELENKKENISESENEESEEETLLPSDVRWKANLAQKAADAFLERQNTSQNLWKLVYGEYKKMWEVNRDGDKMDVDDNEDEIGGIFKIVSEKQRRKVEEKEKMDEEDNSQYPVPVLRNWTEEENKSLIRDCFVTGKWSKSEDAAALLELDDMEDDDVDGDFEDLETGEQHKGQDDGKKGDAKDQSKEALLAKKQKLKQQFDAEYDDKGDNAYHDELKQMASQQAQLNKEELDGLDDDLRVQLEGFRPGLYVRIEIKGVVCELIDKLDPKKPLIVGGLLPGEDNVGFVQVRCKKHRWYPKILKCKDPLVLSLGWRRFQTLPVYSKLEDNMRLRMLKYTPEHISCMAHFYGPITPQTTGCLAIQTLTNQQPGFRICLTGSVVEVNKSTTIVKKLKLVGTPQKIYKKTAFIKGMFNTVLEVGKFEGAKLRTVSGIRGMIKKAAGKPEGTFRAVFEDKIKLSDIVFCRTWTPVEVPKLYNPVTSLLGTWTSMKTVGELKRERGIRGEAQLDSMYTPISRKPKIFQPLKVPKRLEQALPYKYKTKTAVKKAAKFEESRVAVVMEPQEQKVAELMKQVRTNFSDKLSKDRRATRERHKQHKKQMNALERAKMRRQKEVKQQVFRALSKMDKAKAKARNKS